MIFRPRHARLVVALGCFALASVAPACAQEASPIYTQEELILLPAVEEGESTTEEAGLAEEIAALRERIDELEGSEEKRSTAEKEKKAADSKLPSVKWSAEIQADSYWFNQDEANKASYGDIDNGVAFRRARTAIMGEYGPTYYRLEMDFAQAGRPTFLDVWFGIHDLPENQQVRVGHFFEPFGLERQTSNRYITFMERAMIEQAFAPARNTGVRYDRTYADEHGTAALGVFASDSDNLGDDVGSPTGAAITGRITYLPIWEQDGGEYLHLGACYSFRGPRNDEVRFRAQPEARIGAAVPNVPFFVDTGIFDADQYQIACLESAWILGPLSFQAEYMMAAVDADVGTEPFFDGWYGQVSYILTGEHRPYDRKFGVFNRLHPYQDAIRYVGDPKEKNLCRGPGAWEIAGRVTQVDLNDDGFTGGRNTDLTVGLNWYLTPYLKFTSNYIHAMPRDQAGVDSEADIFAMRMGYEF
jgi:phosphate-selective porin OprO/OprP